MQPLVVLADAPDAADRAAILDALVAFNDAAHGPAGYENVAVLLKHPESGATVGGLWGWIVYDWLFVNLLFVPPELRGEGLGSQLMRAAEDKAHAARCAGIWLDTFSFQAPGFYRGLGYELFGELPDHPRGHSRHLFRKILPPSP